ncbi:hypothetical protein K461DRAFT_163035 [Myriangium duriaei CBS 260.36]|uniref:Uncharacterized protein n=1 Tax=Myriangium duriaei CBS 260.36 TaxID=1168546 RepID=A0A9P4J4B5_9PEZI|nr:hypothetical protein K461DRAFT_163035 [Myriangium duriaei CBS 260.36]
MLGLRFCLHDLAFVTASARKVRPASLGLSTVYSFLSCKPHIHASEARSWLFTRDHVLRQLSIRGMGTCNEVNAF